MVQIHLNPNTAAANAGAVAESLFSPLKLELVQESARQTRAEARADVFEYLDVFDNGLRLHSSLG